MSTELDELVLLFTRLNTEYKGESSRPQLIPLPRSSGSQFCAAELPPPVRFIRRNQNQTQSPGNHSPDITVAPPSIEPMINCPENEQSMSGVDLVLDLLLGDYQDDRDFNLHLASSLNEL